jgi:hypothetical protein
MTALTRRANPGLTATILVAVAGLFGLSILVLTSMKSRGDASLRARDEISRWPQAPRLLASLMLERYGPPDDVGENRVTWRLRGPWKRVRVDAEDPQSPLEQTVGYLVLPEAEHALTAFGKGVSFEASRDELTARSEDESLNILALNLAHEVAERRRSVESAREFYDRTAARMDAGKDSRYLQKLLFRPYQPRRPQAPLYLPPEGWLGL